jgi:uncharacterized protein YodC (DUF2158 family)
MIPTGTIVLLKSGGPAMTVMQVDRTDGFYSVVWFDPHGVLQRDAFAEAEIVVVGATAVEITDNSRLGIGGALFDKSGINESKVEPVEPPEFATGRKKIDSTEPYPKYDNDAGLDGIDRGAPEKPASAPAPAPADQDPPREITPQRPQGGRARAKGAPNKLTAYESVYSRPQRKLRKAEREQALGQMLEGEGYRPPPGTIEKVIEDEDDKPIFDKSKAGIAGGWEKPRPSLSKAELRDQLREAASNTATSEEE